MEVDFALQKFCDYSLYMRGMSNSTIKRYRVNLGMFFRRMGIIRVDDISEVLVRSYFYEGRRDRNWSASCFITYHKTFVVFFRWCIAEGLMAKNYADNIEVPRLEKRLPTKLSKTEALRLLEVVYNYPYEYKYLRSRNYAIFAVFIYAGLRKSELLNLKYTDVDTNNLTIFIRQGKGNKDRIIPMSYKLAEILKRYLEERRRLNKTCPEFFASLNRNCGFTDGGLKHLIDLVKKISKIKFSAHKLRHTFATLMLEGGCDIYSLSKMMGHSDIKTTTIYLAATAEHLRSQMIKHPLNDL